LHTMGTSPVHPSVSALTGTGAQMEGRIRRLFAPAVPAQPPVSTWMPLLSRSCILFCLFLSGLFNALMILRLMGCGPLS
jgi:hypothetical protein